MSATTTIYFDGSIGWTNYQNHGLSHKQFLVNSAKLKSHRPSQKEYQKIIDEKIKRIEICRRKVNSAEPGNVAALRYISALLGSHSPKSYEAALALYLQHREIFAAYYQYLGISGISFNRFPALSVIPIQQAYLSRPTPANILLCFTGRTGRLNMPLPIFHALVEKKYDCIAYFFDPFNDNYASIHETIVRACDELLAAFSQSKFSIICTSTGGIMAHSLSQSFNHAKKLCSSPVLSKSSNIVNKLDQGKHERFKRSRFFFSLGPSHYHSSTDRESYLLLLKNLSVETFSSNVYNLGFYSESHATLMNLALMNRTAFDLQLKWLLSD